MSRMRSGRHWRVSMSPWASRVATRQPMIGGAYYDDAWMVMSLLMMTGNFLNYTDPTILPIR